MTFVPYIIECADRTLYVGHTDQLDERMRQHDSGKCNACTAKRRPLKLIHVQEFESRYEALAMERKLKGWSRAKKLAYMAGDGKRVAAMSKGKHRQDRSV
jgi:predicted GIY-YIG superfamily endonuclease